MKTSTNGINLIKEYEGFLAKTYLCPAGKPTIGYGHALRAGEFFSAAGISAAEAEKLLISDLEIAKSTINQLVIAQISQNQFDALASFIYNVGAKNFAKSSLLRLINENSPAAAGEFGKWVFAGGKRLSGLEKRRNAEMKLFSS